MVNVKAHARKTKSGKPTRVRPHTRKTTVVKTIAHPGLVKGVAIRVIKRGNKYAWEVYDIVEGKRADFLSPDPNMFDFDSADSAFKSAGHDIDVANQMFKNIGEQLSEESKKRGGKPVAIKF